MKKIIALLIAITALQTLANNPPAETYFFVTGNAGKFKEIKQVLPQILQLDIDLPEIQSTSGKAVIEKKLKEAFNDIDQKIADRMNGRFKSDAEKETFIRNAELAIQAFKNGTARIIVEDTSLYFDSLANTKAQNANPEDTPNGLPGPLIKYFMETMDNGGLHTLAQTFGNDAKAVTWIGYSDGRVNYYFKGEVAGKIVQPAEGKGFGWDPIFKPNESQKTFAQMTPEEKNNYSMRGIAAMKLKESLEKR